MNNKRLQAVKQNLQQAVDLIAQDLAERDGVPGPAPIECSECDALHAHVQKLHTIVQGITEVLAYSERIGKMDDGEWVSLESIYFRYKDALIATRATLKTMLQQCGESEDAQC